MRSSNQTELRAPEPRSASFRSALAQVERFARDRSAPILIEGESGTGKTTIARHLHRCSPRANSVLHTVVLSTLDDSLAGSELFGHVIGAFTDARANRAGHFVSANGGTLFLDEIGKASRQIQQKLLHAIEYGEIRAVGSDRDVRVDVRVVVASNVALQDLVDRNDFLPDLYMRIATFRVVLPPLRERRADIPDLVDYYLATHVGRRGRGSNIPSVAPDLMDSLRAASWPGNLRQLDATVHRLLVDAEEADVLSLDHCCGDLAWLRSGTSRRELTAESIDCAISRAGSITGAARLLGVDRTTVHRFQRKRSAAKNVAPHIATNAPGVAQQQGPLTAAS